MFPKHKTMREKKKLKQEPILQLDCPYLKENSYSQYTHKTEVLKNLKLEKVNE